MKKCQEKLLSSKREGDFINNGEPEDRYYYYCEFADVYYEVDKDVKPEVIEKYIPQICRAYCSGDPDPLY